MSTFRWAALRSDSKNVVLTPEELDVSSVFIVGLSWGRLGDIITG
jgi:hypothetical protein